MQIEVEYAANVGVGDVVAGEVNPSAPTRPVSDFAAAMVVRHVSEVPSARYTFHYDLEGLLLSPSYTATQQLILIRGGSE